MSAHTSMHANVGFEVPTGLTDLLALLNGGGLRLSLIDPSGAVHGHLAEVFGKKSVGRAAAEGRIRVLAGSDEDTLMLFATEAPDEAAAFLYGCFYGVFRGKRVEDIHDAVILPWEMPPA